MSTVLFVVLLILLIGAVPAWPYSKDWGPGPGGGIGFVLLLLILLMLLGKI